MSNITQVVNVDKNMKILKKGVHASDLDQVLSSSGPYTFFAPNDLAFEKLEKGLMDGLLEPQNRPKLADLLSNHIVSGKVDYKDLKDGDKLTTLNGKELLVEIKNGSVNIDGALILPREAKISNGVIHTSDTVLTKK
jgi:Secreted and surface protein containing fasciclin-like repeats